MKLIILIFALLFSFACYPVSKVEVTQGAGALSLIKPEKKAAPIIVGKGMLIQFKYPTNVNLKVWHNTVTFISTDMIHWQVLGTNIIETQLTKKVPVYLRQCIVMN